MEGCGAPPFGKALLQPTREDSAFSFRLLELVYRCTTTAAAVVPAHLFKNTNNWFSLGFVFRSGAFHADFNDCRREDGRLADDT